MSSIIQKLGIDLTKAAEVSSTTTIPTAADCVSSSPPPAAATSSTNTGSVSSNKFNDLITISEQQAGLNNNSGGGGGISDSNLSMAAGVSTFVIAYAVHKVFAPFRIGITLTSTPLIVRYLRARGWLKPPKAT